MAKKKTEISKPEAVRMNEADDYTQNDISIRPTARPEALKVGDKVKLKIAATVYGTNTAFPAECYKQTFYITDIRGNKAVISLEKHTGTCGSIAGAVDLFGLAKA